MIKLLWYRLLMPLISIGSCALWSVLLKKTGLHKADSRKKNIITGVFFGIIAVGTAIISDLAGKAYSGGLIIGSDGIISVCAGLFFSGSAGMISAVMETVYEIIAFIVSGSEYVHISNAIAAILSGLSAMLVSKYLLRNRRPSVGLCILSGLEVSALNVVIYPIISLSISENLGRFSEVAIIPMYLVNTIGLVGALFAVRKITTGSFRYEKTDSYDGIRIQRRTAVIGTIVFIATAAVIYVCITAISRKSIVAEMTGELDAAVKYVENHKDKSWDDPDKYLIYNPGQMVVADSDGRILSHFAGSEETLEEAGIDITAEDSENCLYGVTYRGRDYLLMFRRVSDYILVDMVEEQPVYNYRIPLVMLIISIEILIMYVLIISMGVLIEKELVLREEEINKSLSEVMGKNSDRAANDEYSMTGSVVTGYLEDIVRRIRGEMKFAGDIQKQSLPMGSMLINGVGIRAAVKPARVVGGDFYDYFLIDENRMAFIIADVSGKGISAAMFMMRAKAAIRSMTAAANRDIAARVNDMLCEGNEDGMFVTAWMGLIDAVTGTVYYVNAAQGNRIYRDAGEEYRLIEDDPEAPLGIKKGKKYDVRMLKMTPGSRLFLYTDGVTDACNAADEMYGEERILSYLNENCRTSNGDETVTGFIEELDAYIGEEEQFDDVTVMTLDYFGQAEDYTYTERTFKAADERLDEATDFINSLLEPLGCSDAQLMEIDVAFEELFVNIAHYAYPEKEGDVKIGVSTDHGLASLRLTDSGVMFNPLRQSGPDSSIPLHERKEGGLGITMVKTCMNYVDYKYENGKNIFTMIKIIR